MEKDKKIEISQNENDDILVNEIEEVEMNRLIRKKVIKLFFILIFSCFLLFLL